MTGLYAEEPPYKDEIQKEMKKWENTFNPEDEREMEEKVLGIR